MSQVTLAESSLEYETLTIGTDKWLENEGNAHRLALSCYLPFSLRLVLKIPIHVVTSFFTPHETSRLPQDGFS